MSDTKIFEVPRNILGKWVFVYKQWLAKNFRQAGELKDGINLSPSAHYLSHYANH